ncbi:MAG TPA: potassium-transporting ATPase subunit KdpA [Thermoplasmata archaeon]|jgi:K+-transporting ATPase ATPase A chain|nr:potassium-transporting ATPase subunit KdpA [Thermoplasmata archaeon]
MAFVIQSLWDIILVIGLSLAIAPFFGDYLGKVYMNRPLFGDAILLPLENGFYRLLGTTPRHSMRAREYFLALILVNGGLLAFLWVWFFYQASMPLNPLGIPNMGWDLAFHSAASFTTNTNYTHFTNESQVSLGSLMIAWPFALFLSPATGLAVLAAMVRGFVRKDGTLGNFYVDMTRSLTRLLIPIAILGAVVFILMDVPETLSASVTLHPLTGGTQTLYLGPVASYQSISLLGSNGGGFYSANMASPIANPSAVSNLWGIALMLLFPFSAPFAFATIVRKKNEAWPYVGVILIILAIALALFIAFQAATNPALASSLGLGPQTNGYPVGEETRFSLPEAASFQVVSVYCNVGANNLQIGSVSPVAQLVLLFGMFTQSTPGGVGTGFGQLLLFAVLGIFVGGLMVGRTPEYLGKKIGTAQVKWSALALLVHPATILIPFVVAVAGGFVMVDTSSIGATTHNFTSVLYEFTSESANNGSALSTADVVDTTLFFNVTGALIMLIGRYVPILAMLMVADLFSKQEALPPSAGTLRTASGTFTIYMTLFLVIVTSLLFLPVMAMGPLAQIFGGM